MLYEVVKMLRGLILLFMTSGRNTCNPQQQQLGLSDVTDLVMMTMTMIMIMIMTIVTRTWCPWPDRRRCPGCVSHQRRGGGRGEVSAARERSLMISVIMIVMMIMITAGSMRQEPGLCVSRGGDQCEGRAAEAGGDQRDPLPHLPRLHRHWQAHRGHRGRV